MDLWRFTLMFGDFDKFPSEGIGLLIIFDAFDGSRQRHAFSVNYCFYVATSKSPGLKRLNNSTFI